MLKNEIQKLFSSRSEWETYSGKLSLLAEAAIASGLEEQGLSLVDLATWPWSQPYQDQQKGGSRMRDTQDH